MDREKHTEIPEDEMGMSGYSKLAWEFWRKVGIPMTQCVAADKVVRECGYHYKAEIINNLWNTRVHLVELYHKYRNKADKHSLTEGEQMFYQGRAEAIWECIHELDELRKKYVEVMK